MTETATAQEITFTRVLDAPRELVWQAWTQPDRLALWWGPDGWSTSPDDVTLDLRPGGAFRVTSVSEEDGTEMTTVAVVDEVVEPERLVVHESAEDNWHEGALSVVTFHDLGNGRTELTLRTTIQTTDEMRLQSEAGIAGSLDRLAGLFA
jgi:uncharacterized protein YndB with AHSA1/START domain